MNRRTTNTERDPHLDRALEIFQPRTSRELTREDAREIDRNLTGFFNTLLRWQRAEQGQSTGGEASGDNPHPSED